MRRDGKAVKKAGESEDLPAYKLLPPRTEVIQQDLEDKKGKSPGRLISVRVFFRLGLMRNTKPRKEKTK